MNLSGNPFWYAALQLCAEEMASNLEDSRVHIHCWVEKNYPQGHRPRGERFGAERIEDKLKVCQYLAPLIGI